MTVIQVASFTNERFIMSSNADGVGHTQLLAFQEGTREERVFCCTEF